MDNPQYPVLPVVRHDHRVPAIDHESDVPVYLQLAAILRGRIERGELAPRRPVPSKRQLTQEYGIAGGTVDKALAVLRGEKLVKTVRGRGIYVTAPEER
jgi:GntR family transcriptional regulator